MNNSNNASDGNKFKDGLPEDVVQLYNKEEKEASEFMAELDKKLTEKEAKKVAFTGTRAELRESVAKLLKQKWAGNSLPLIEPIVDMLVTGRLIQTALKYGYELQYLMPVLEICTEVLDISKIEIVN